MIASSTGREVREDRTKLVRLDHRADLSHAAQVVDALRNDSVVLVRNVPAEDADSAMRRVAAGLGLEEALELQAGFAGVLGHRHGIGKYYMSVNERTDYQFIAAHSEGTSFSSMELAAFYCHENTTDGGETILFHIDTQSDAWATLRERVTRGKITGRALTASEIARARGLYQLNLPSEILRDDDEVLAERPSTINGLTLVTALAKPQPCYSRLLQRNVQPYWATIANIDADAGLEFADLLKRSRLLKEPPGGLPLTAMDADAKLRIRHFGVAYEQIFDCRITYKLAARDFVVLNNMTWSHAVNNWSPGSGIRRIAAAFA